MVIVPYRSIFSHPFLFYFTGDAKHIPTDFASRIFFLASSSYRLPALPMSGTNDLERFKVSWGSMGRRRSWVFTLQYFFCFLVIRRV